MLIRLAPWLFVVLWSTGYIGSKYGVAYAEPLTMLTLRFVAVVILIATAAVILRTSGLSPRAFAMQIGVGALIHGVYLGGVFWAIDRGMPAGVAALIVCLQPILTASAGGWLLGERITLRHWGGLWLGLAGVALVLAPKMATGDAGFTVATVLACVISLAAITAGTLWQKASAAGLPLRASLLPQFIGAAAVVGAGAGLSEAGEITWSPVFIAALAWLTLVLSIGAITLLLILVRENEAWRTASLFYLVPPITAVMAWALFGETLTVVQLIGMMLVTGAILSLQTRRAETIAAPGGAKRSAA